LPEGVPHQVWLTSRTHARQTGLTIWHCHGCRDVGSVFTGLRSFRSLMPLCVRLLLFRPPLCWSTGGMLDAEGVLPNSILRCDHPTASAHTRGVKIHTLARCRVGKRLSPARCGG